MSEQARHVVAVIGGAVSGSVATEILVDNGVEVIVIEQNDRPYGKIEDGLPRWHVHQRRQEYDRINARLSKDGVHYVPRTKLGRDVDFAQLTGEWGLSAVLLANGAWRDRPLAFSEANDYIGKGIEYQNPLIYWFNHKNESDFDGRPIEIPDGALVFGGGLASIDVVKVCQLVNYGKALRERGIDVDEVQMEKKGIPTYCEMNGIDAKELGIKGCTLLYRRRRQDMPLAQPPKDATPEQMQKTLNAREKLLSRAQERFLFNMQDRTLPLSDGLVIEDGRVAGVKVQRTEVEGRKVTPIEGSEEVLETGLIIGSIGSIPEPISGIRMRGETFDFKDWDLGVYDQDAGIFGVGNVVTGQGNIRASLMHAKMVTSYLMENYFAGAMGAAGAEVVREHLEKKQPLDGDQVTAIRARVKELQQRAGYDGDYMAWIEKVTPADLE